MTPDLLAGARLPSGLGDLARPPKRLYCWGELPAGPIVAIVGTRKPTHFGQRFALKLARSLAREGVIVASGGAEGIDTAAHLGALLAGKKTIVMAPAGFERPFPEKNENLFRRIVAEGGCYLSLVDAATPARRGQFFARNGALVALSCAVVIVEAPLRSGAGNAAKQARNLGRALFAVPHTPSNTRGRGCNAEIRRGARLLESAREVLDFLERTRQHRVVMGSTRQREALTLPIDNDEGSAELADPERVFEAVLSGANSAEAAAGLTGLPADRVQVALLKLLLNGRIVIRTSGEVCAI